MESLSQWKSFFSRRLRSWLERLHRRCVGGNLQQSASKLAWLLALVMAGRLRAESTGLKMELACLLRRVAVSMHAVCLVQHQVPTEGERQRPRTVHPEVLNP